MKIYTDYSLLAHNTFGMEVKAAQFVEYSSEEELVQLLEEHPEFFVHALHIGQGSNLLFTQDYAGTVLHSAIRGIKVVSETEKEVLVRAGAGEVWDDFVAYAVQQQWYGAENLSLIPGEVGASAIQNIGAYGVEVKDLIVEVEAFEIATGKKRIFKCEECEYAYRESIFKKELKGKYIVTYVTYRLDKLPHFKLEYGNVRSELEKMGVEPSLQTVRQVIVSIRQAKLPDPKVQGNAGSFFMNPMVNREKFEELLGQYPSMPHYMLEDGRVKIPAAWMIDQCGWKGRQEGRAGVHPKQALVLVNCGGATGQEIIALSDHIRASVQEKFGVAIFPEVMFIA